MSNITERYLTICLKLHHLSQKKKDAIDLGMGRYSYGYRVLLERAKKERFPAPEDRAGRYKALLHFVNSGVLKELPVNPFKDALSRQFCIQTARGWGKPVKDTIRFYRYSSSREYCILYDEKKARYYAKLHVLCKEDPPFAPPERIEPARFSMVGGEIRLFSARPRYLLAPLSFGKRQWEILELARKGEAKLCAAALTRKNGEYFLNISVKLSPRQIQELQTFLGVCRLETKDLSLCLCAQNGDPVFFREVDLDEAEEKESLHRMANQITDLARGQHAQVILERLVGRSDGLERPKLAAKRYLALGRILNYKLPTAGVAAPVWVSPARLFSRCPRCGKVSSQNRIVAGAVFLCVNCGYAMEMRQLGPINLARRLITYREGKILFTKIKKGAVYEYENKRFHIRALLPSDEALGAYLLHMTERYERQAASLVRKIRQADSVFDVIDIVEKDSRV